MSDNLRWVCDQYRKKLLEVDPLACREVDILMAQAGQGWIADETVIDPDQLVTAQDLQDRFGISHASVARFARRHRIEVRGKSGKFNMYRLGDVLRARATGPRTVKPEIEEVRRG